MKETIKQQKTIFIVSICVVLLTVAVFEMDMLPTGVLPPNSAMEFYALMVMELALVALIPLSLRLFKFKKIAEELSVRKEKALQKWGSIRLAMLILPLFINTLLYYMFMSTTFGYMAIILLICMAFVYPNTDKCYFETRDREE